MSCLPILGIKAEPFEEKLAAALILRGEIPSREAICEGSHKKVELIFTKLMSLPETWRTEIALEVLCTC